MPAFVVESLRRHRREQASHRLRIGEAWRDLDLVVDRGDGQIRSPHGLTEAFQSRLRKASVERVRSTTCDTAAATLMLGGGEDLKVVSELLGHAGIAITADVYASVLPKLKTDAAPRLDRLLGTVG